MTDEQHGRRYRLGAVALAVLFVAVGVVALIVGLQAQQAPPQAPSSAATAAPPTEDAVPGEPSSSSGEQSPAAEARGPVLPASAPARIDIPAVGVVSDLLDLGLNPDETVEVPPLDEDSKAGWYRDSPTPGELGPSLILGHVDSVEYGPAIFFRLGELRPGDEVTVTRDDGTVAVFTIDRVATYAKDSFPTLEVYGNTDRAELRLITCGGDFDAGSRNYLDNIVVYASLTGSTPA
jgi:sortase (surface protein transpeptidase)